MKSIFHHFSRAIIEANERWECDFKYDLHGIWRYKQQNYGKETDAIGINLKQNQTNTS